MALGYIVKGRQVSDTCQYEVLEHYSDKLGAINLAAFHWISEHMKKCYKNNVGQKLTLWLWQTIFKLIIIQSWMKNQWVDLNLQLIHTK